MKATTAALLLIAMAALAPSGVLGQRAMKPLLPEGQLFLPVGNFSAMEKNLRLYGEVTLAAGDRAFADGSNYDVVSAAIAPAIDFKAGPSIISLGYSSTATIFSTVVSGVDLEEQNINTNLGGRISFPFGESGVAAAQVFSKFRTITVTASSGGFSSSDSADTDFIDIAGGAGLDLSERIRIAGGFSPEVSDKTQFTGSLAGSETRDGHGAQFGLGLGYNTPRFAMGLDFEMEGESQDSGDAERRAVSATAEVLLGESSLRGRFEFFQAEPLHIDGAFVSPDTEGSIIGFLLRIPLGRGVLGFGLERLDEEGFNSGLPSEDAARFDSLEIISLSARLTVDF